jgi:hypothetical protein
MTEDSKQQRTKGNVPGDGASSRTGFAVRRLLFAVCPLPFAVAEQPCA